ncbi:LCP family protein [Alicyclobacillus cycloheptanicus]|uniref:LCP family protein required for cell wall assembly n=1 Tax=Alicyclobacillus cycloheptanicus TaxID=1457 RepID=A0ABT9XD47_9BACL|nr:LCP family protein [Alicyclobacillus cycloheptanicus]MDQ0188219.1 LCP family protein required for cell wall assembly [Alicyclobacillus cycloheptanicus]WDM00949.1 LCP family protein [Alicyclobacillus cycloheptanicus]
MAGRHRQKDKRENPSRRRPRKFFLWSAVCVVVLGGAGAAYYYMTRPLSSATSKYSVKPVTMKKTADDQERTNILLIGTDTRPGQTGGNTDVLILCSIDPKHKRIELLSIPRDTKVQFPDGSVGKINEALDLGGPQMTINMVYGLIHQPIDHYALTHFGGLVDIINTLGGITVDVPERMYYNTGDKQWNIINLKPGVQTLNGVQALGFVRFREDPLGDIGRTERQQEFLTALADKLLEPANIPKLPTLIREFWGTIDTDMSLVNVLSLASDANQFKSYKIIHETLPGSFHNPSYPGDSSYWIVNPAEAVWAANQFFQNGVVQSNPVQAPSVTENWTPPANSTAGTTNSTSGGASQTTNATTSGGSAASNEAAGATANSTQAAASSAPWYTVSVYGANVRSGPGTNYAILSSVKQGQEVQVVGTSGDWDEVEFGDGETGYIANWLVTPDAGTSQ